MWRSRRARRLRVLAVPLLLVAMAGWEGTSVLAQQNASAVDFTAGAGEGFTGTVATFEEARAVPPDRFTATIDWGDGAPPSAGTVTQVGRAGSYDVAGSHTYAAAGRYAFRVTITGPSGTVHASGTANVTAAPPPAPPPPTTGPTATISLAKTVVRPGEPAIVDASGSTGTLFAFDLNGNGTYETKGPLPVASVVHTVPGAKRIGVRVVGPDGKTATADATLDVTGTAMPPPVGQPLKKGTVAGSLHSSTGAAGVEAALKNFNCPITVQVGVAEATIPQEPVFPPTPGEPCFERVTGPPKPGLKPPPGAYPRFVAGKEDVLMNGLEIDTRVLPNASNNPLVIYEQKKVVAQEKASWVPVQIRLRKPGVGSIISEQFKFGSWDVASPGVVGTFPIEDFFHPTMMGLPVVAKETPVEFTAGHGSRLEVFVVPPFNLSLLGPKSSPTGQSPLILRADNTDGLQVEGSIVASGGKYQLDLPLGIFHLKGTLSYSQEGASHVWSGDFNLRIPDTPVNNITGKMRFKDGSFEQANVHVPFARPGLGPIGCCVYLVGLEGQLTSHAIQGKATFAAGPDLIGDFRAAEVTASVSWQFSPFVLAFNADQLRIAKWEVGANTGVVITSNKFLGFAFWEGDLAVLEWDLNVETMIGKPWYIAGGGTACAGVWPFKGCANVNGAAGPKGITACAGISVGVADIEGGIRVPWNPLNASDYSIYDGCSFSLVKAKVSAARVAAIRAATGRAAASYPVRVPRGLRAALFVIEGRDAQPRVRLTGPGGTEITTPEAGVDTTEGRNWLAVRDTNDNSVRVVVGTPAAGRWRVRELAGSPRVSSVKFAEALPTRFARGRVSGRGRTRTLHYRVAEAPGTRVTFVERGGDPGLADPTQRVEQTIGRARGSRGSIRFTPGEGKLRRRRIEAVVESQGAVVETEPVARFTAPRFRLPAAPRVKLRRAGRTLVARWSKISDARAYQVFVNRSDGATRYFRRAARQRGVRVRGFGRLGSAAVEVRAVSPAGFIGKAGRGTLRALPPFEISRRQPTAKVLRAGGFRARCTAAGDGRCEVTVRRGRATLASGSRRLPRGQTRPVSIKLTRAGRGTLLRARQTGRAVVATVVPVPPGVGARTLRVRFR